MKVDISANLKNAVTKSSAQKILLALAEKAEITQKTYGPSIILSDLFVRMLLIALCSREADILCSKAGEINALTYLTILVF